MGKLEQPAGKPKKRPKTTKRELSAADSRILKAAERTVFGKNVRAARNAHGYSLTEMSNRIDADRAYIGKVERGKINVSIDRMSSIAALFGVHLHELLQPNFTLGYKDIRPEDSQTITTPQYDSTAKGRRRQKEK